MIMIFIHVITVVMSLIIVVHMYLKIVIPMDMVIFNYKNMIFKVVDIMDPHQRLSTDISMVNTSKTMISSVMKFMLFYSFIGICFLILCY